MPRKLDWNYLTGRLMGILAVMILVGLWLLIGFYTLTGAYRYLASLKLSTEGVLAGLVTSGASLLIVSILVGGLYLIYRLFKRWIAPELANYVVEQDWKAHQQALMRRAMERVGNSPDTHWLTLQNAGWICYRHVDDQQPVLIQAVGQIPQETRYLRPFIELMQNSLLDEKVEHQIKIEVCQHNNNIIFDEMQTHHLQYSQNLLIAKNWLAVEELSRRSPWSLRVRVDGKLLAIHLFKWSKFNEAQLASEKLMDGEISRKLQHLVEKNDGVTGMSLDELLNDQSVAIQ